MDRRDQVLRNFPTVRASRRGAFQSAAFFRQARHAPRIPAFVLLVSLIPTSSLWACSCAGKGPPCQMAWTADAVFTGTVVEITEPRVPTINNGSPTGRRMATDPAVSMPSRKRTVRIQVADVLTGVEPSQNEIEILTGRTAKQLKMGTNAGQSPRLQLRHRFAQACSRGLLPAFASPRHGHLQLPILG